LSEEEVEYNIETTAKYLKRATPMKQWLEMVSDDRFISQGVFLTETTGNRHHWW